MSRRAFSVARFFGAPRHVQRLARRSRRVAAAIAADKHRLARGTMWVSHKSKGNGAAARSSAGGCALTEDGPLPAPAQRPDPHRGRGASGHSYRLRLNKYSILQIAGAVDEGKSKMGVSAARPPRRPGPRCVPGPCRPSPAMTCEKYTAGGGAAALAPASSDRASTDGRHQILQKQGRSSPYT